MNENLLTGDVLDEHHELTIHELCHACSVKTERVFELVEEGILEPSGRTRMNWRFTAVSIQTVRKTERLQQDLGINLAGVALVLDLMDEIERLRSRLSVLDRPPTKK
ncbi:MAG: chaperone modulator CbpM [Rubricoccaceae bacterium]|nr:chaperone modulator CbpM [Rubricoccaceae bacterium]